MNQKKIGKFIQELRKEKKMTQQELADKIVVTDRAVSKWENGRGMPELSLLIPLCEVLDITINELLSGERLDKKEYQEKLEKNIINAIDYSDKKIKKTKNIFIIVLIIISFVLMILFMFSIDVDRMKNNKPVLFSTWGFSYTPPIDLKETEIEFSILKYIVQKSDSEDKRYENEKTFANMRIYLIEENEKDNCYNVYAWVLTEKYYLDNEQLKIDSASSIPHRFVVKNIDGKFKVVDSKIPRDGSLYLIDMKNIFPNSVRKDMENVQNDGTIERLILINQNQARLYFHI